MHEAPGPGCRRDQERPRGRAPSLRRSLKVILNADLDKVGRKGDVVEVKAGFARNYLLPRNLASRATKGTLREAENVRQVRSERERKEVESANALAERIAATSLRLSARAGEEGQLFGSITSSEVADRLAEDLGFEIDRRKLQIEAIRSLGMHDFEVRLHPEVTAKGSVEVVAET